MSKEEVSRDLLEFISSNLIDSNIELTEKTDLQNVAGIDSMAMVEIILFIERKFNVGFADDELHPQLFSSVENLSLAVINHN